MTIAIMLVTVTAVFLVLSAVIMIVSLIYVAQVCHSIRAIVSLAELIITLLGKSKGRHLPEFWGTSFSDVIERRNKSLSREK